MSTAPGWRGEWRGALNATAALLPFALSFGFMVYGALGAAAGPVGLRAALVALVLAAVVMALLDRSQLPAAAPSASACLMLGGAVLALLRDPALAAGTPQSLALLLAATALTVMLSGLTMMLLGLLKAGSLVRFVPQPVLAGFMNGVAVLIVVSQLPPLLGLPAGAWESQGLRSLAEWRGPAPLVAAGTVLLVAMLAWRWPRLPAPLLGLALAGTAVALWQGLAPAGWPGTDLPRIGLIEAPLPRLDTLAPLAGGGGVPAGEAWQALAAHARLIGTTALLLALIGALESVLALATLDQQTGARSDPNRMLLALGASNVVSGLLGGLPLVYLRLRALATWAGGGRSLRAVLLGCGLLALVAGLGLPLLQHLSTAVVAGVLVVLAWTLVDPWTRQLLQAWRRGEHAPQRAMNLALVALVGLVTVGWGFAAGVAAGVLASMVVFVLVLQRSLVRDSFTAADFPSRRVHAPRDEQWLAPLRRRIAVLELEGALFFGSADRLVEWGQRVAQAGAEAPTDLIVDLRRVTTIDASGAFAINRLARELQPLGTRLHLAGVRPGGRHALSLAAHGLAVEAAAAPSEALPLLQAHADLDQAIEAAEAAALLRARPGGSDDTVPLAQCALAEGLDEPQLATLAACLRPRTLRAGERLFAQGDAGDALYLLTRGSVSVRDATSGQRFVSFSPGMCLGETAVLDGGGRTAEACADIDSELLEMPAAALAAWERSDPALAARLYRNLATHLSQRLRAAAAAWRRAAG